MLTSCFEEDERVVPHDSGDVETATVGMTQNYSQMIFYDLGTSSPVLEVEKFGWDIAFESSTDGWRAYLNTTRFMMAAASTLSSFDQVLDTTGLKWKFDKSDGNPDSTAIGQWFDILAGDSISKQTIYIIDLGYTNSGVALGLRKFRITSFDKDSYTIQYSKMDGSELTEMSINKLPGMPLVFYSMRNHQTAQGVWPSPDSWDLWFTQYTTLLYTNEGEPYPYIVTGVLINHRDGVQVAVDTTMDFQTISFDIAETLDYSAIADRIGYEWKWYDFDAGSYSVLPERNYLIRTTEGYLYKLRFIGFYNQEGEKGYPTFEFQRL